MLAANLLLCCYPLYQLRNHVPGDKPDFSIIVVIIAFALALVNLLLVPLALIKTWLHCRDFPHPRRLKMLLGALLMSLIILAPVVYWVALFTRARNGS